MDRRRMQDQQQAAANAGHTPMMESGARLSYLPSTARGVRLSSGIVIEEKRPASSVTRWYAETPAALHLAITLLDPFQANASGQQAANA